MPQNALPPRDANGQLPAYAWPGGYPIYYLDKQSNVCCPACASREIDQSQEPIAAGVNWEDPDMHCDDCGKRIESAYAEDGAEDQRCDFCRENDVFRTLPDGTADRTTCRHTGM